MAEDEKFMSRWARRKAENREGSLVEDDVDHAGVRSRWHN